MVGCWARFHIGGLQGEIAYNRFWRSSHMYLFFKISERFDIKNRRDVREKKVVEPV